MIGTVDPARPGVVADRRVELTVRGIIIGALITLVFTAANVYLGLKVGLTFASSIPAAVISMAVLRFLSGLPFFKTKSTPCCRVIQNRVMLESVMGRWSHPLAICFWKNGTTEPREPTTLP